MSLGVNKAFHSTKKQEDFSMKSLSPQPQKSTYHKPYLKLFEGAKKLFKIVPLNPSKQPSKLHGQPMKQHQ